MDTKQPEALRIADDLHHSITHYGAEDAFTFAAYEAEQCVRALHAENESLQARVQELGKAARDVNSRRVQELEAQLEAIGAGGVEPLRKRECLHQITEPAQPAAQAGEQNHLPLAITSAPERIWLDLGFNPYEDDVHFSHLHDVTWSQNNATGGGVEYVRADLAAGGAAQAAPAPSASIEQEAMQMLWNDQQQEKKEHYRNVARGAERIK